MTMDREARSPLVLALVLAGMLAALSGCSQAAPVPGASSASPAPGTFTVHMNGEMTNAAGAASR